MYSKKDGSVRRVEADVKIYLSYSTNRKPIACLLHDIMTDVRANAALHSNQIDAFSGYAIVAVVLALVTHVNARSESWVASAAASGCAHICVCSPCACWRTFVCQLICAFGANALRMWIRLCYRAKAAGCRTLPWIPFANRGGKEWRTERKEGGETDLKRKTRDNVCVYARQRRRKCRITEVDTSGRPIWRFQWLMYNADIIFLLVCIWSNTTSINKNKWDKIAAKCTFYKWQSNYTDSKHCICY